MRQHEFVNSAVVVDFLKFLKDTWTDGSFSHSWVSRSKLHTGLPVGQRQQIHSMRQALQVHRHALPHVPPYKQRTLAQHARSLQTQHALLLQQLAAATRAVATACSGAASAALHMAQACSAQGYRDADASLQPYTSALLPQPDAERAAAVVAVEDPAVERNFFRQAPLDPAALPPLAVGLLDSANPALTSPAITVCKSLLLHINFLLALHGHPKLSLSKSVEQLLLLPKYCDDLQAFMRSDVAELPASVCTSPWFSASAAPLAALLAQPLQLSSSRVTLGMALLVRYYWAAGHGSLLELPDELRFSWQGLTCVHNPNPTGFAVFPALNYMDFGKRLLEQQRLHWLLQAWQQQLQRDGLITEDLQQLPAVDAAHASRYLLSAALYTTGYAAWDIDYHHRFTAAKSADDVADLPASADCTKAQIDDLQAFMQQQADIESNDQAREHWLAHVRRWLGK